MGLPMMRFFPFGRAFLVYAGWMRPLHLWALTLTVFAIVQHAPCVTVVLPATPAKQLLVYVTPSAHTGSDVSGQVVVGVLPVPVKTLNNVLSFKKPATVPHKGWTMLFVFSGSKYWW
jgi:hypothetical protein